MTVWLSVFFGFFAVEKTIFSGVVGFEINDLLQHYMGLIGAILVMAFLAVIYLVIRLKMTPEKISAALKKTKKEIQDDFNPDQPLPSDEAAIEQTDYEKELIDTVITPTQEINLDPEPIEDEILEEPTLKTVEEPTKVEVPEMDSGSILGRRLWQ